METWEGFFFFFLFFYNLLQSNPLCGCNFAWGRVMLVCLQNQVDPNSIWPPVSYCNSLCLHLELPVLWLRVDIWQPGLSDVKQYCYSGQITGGVYEEEVARSHWVFLNDVRGCLSKAGNKICWFKVCASLGICKEQKKLLFRTCSWEIILLLWLFYHQPNCQNCVLTGIFEKE